MVDGTNDRRDGFTRRDAMMAAAAAGVTGLAGCGGGGGDGEDTTTTTTTSGDGGGGGDGGDGGDTTTETTTRQMSDQTFRFAWARDASLPDTELNDFSPSSQHELVWPLHFEMGQFNLPTREFIHLDTEGWEVDTDNNEFRIQIKDGVKWHQGGEIIDDFTGEDWAMQEHLNRLLTQVEGEASEEPTVVGWDYDGKTFIRQLNENGYNPRNLVNGLQRTSVSVYREDWRDLYESLRDASTSDEGSEIRTDIIERSITLADDPPLSGPYMLQSVSAQQAEFERHSEHWTMEHSDWTNWDLVKISPTSGADYQAALSDRIDLSFGMPDTVDSVPEPLTIVYSEAGLGFCNQLSVNYVGEMDPWFGFEEVNPEENVAGKRQALARQGLAYAISSTDIHSNQHSKFVANTLSPIEKPLPTHPATAQSELPDLWEAVPTMIDKVYEQKAEEKLRASGLAKENGTWVKPNGDAVTITLQSFSWSRDMISTITEDLNDIGLNAEHSVTESSVLFSKLGEGSHAAAQAWLNWSSPLDQTSQPFVMPNEGYPTQNEPFRWKVPPIGEYDAEPTQTWDVREIATPVQQASNHDQATVKESIRKLSWIFAYHVPVIPCQANAQSTGYNGAHFEFPDHPERQSGGRVVTPGDGSEGAPVWSPVFGAWRLLRKNPAPPNDVTARQ